MEIILIRLLALIMMLLGLSNCSGHYKYCIASEHFDAGTESKSLGKQTIRETKNEKERY